MLKSQNIRIDSEVDEIDRSILSILGKNGRISNADLASQVGIAASTCLGRVRSLVQRKVIRSFAADIAPEALGLELQALISVSLRAGARANLASFMTAMREHPQVIQVFFPRRCGGFHCAYRSRRLGRRQRVCARSTKQQCICGNNQNQHRLRPLSQGPN